MKLLVFLSFAACASLMAADARLAGVQAVYVLPMSRGMDQYLANRLTANGVFRIVADPQKADTILTDSLGENFERRMEDLYPPPAPPKAAAADTGDKDKDKEKDKAAADEKDRETIKAEAKRASQPMSSLGRGPGNYFLVDRATRNVIWSMYERPKDSRPDTLSHTADRVAERIKHDLHSRN